ncbi:hypothetical protein E4U21_002288 [Claviceps maximensis]|nr:hypothetical protein E4U21_002288 [Claviceps maximensis]
MQTKALLALSALATVGFAQVHHLADDIIDMVEDRVDNELEHLPVGKLPFGGEPKENKPYGYGQPIRPANSYPTGAHVPYGGPAHPYPTARVTTSLSSMSTMKVVPSPKVNGTLVTKVVTAYTTFCPYATTITIGHKTYTVTEPTTLTVLDCPCTVVETHSGPAPVPVMPTPAPPGPGNMAPPAPGNMAPPAPGNMAPPAPENMTPPAPENMAPPAPGNMSPPAPGNMSPPAPGNMSPPAPGNMSPPAPGNMSPPAPGNMSPPAPGNMSPPAPGTGNMTPPETPVMSNMDHGIPYNGTNTPSNPSNPNSPTVAGAGVANGGSIAYSLAMVAAGLMGAIAL